MRGSRPLALALLALAVVFALAAIFYFTQKTNFLASGSPAIHWKHAIVFTVLTLLAVVAANFARPKVDQGLSS
jgi:predicted Co/Zn/Cd cation transporter (cation efflux family)